MTITLLPKRALVSVESNLEGLYASSPPPFGHATLEYFGLDPEYTNLNHGSFGSVPKPVIAAANAFAEQVEHNPDKFIRLVYEPTLNQIRARLAKMINAQTDECVLVPNVATGISTILRNFTWHKEDVLIIPNIAFDAILRAVQNIGATEPHPTVSEFELALPLSHAEILELWRTHLRSVKATSEARGCTFEDDIYHMPRPECKIVAIIDTIASGPSIVLPWQAMVQICREEGVWSVVDAAHSIGQERGIDLGLVQPDFWVSSCSKWLYAKRGCAILYVPKRNQHIIKSTLPTAAFHASPSTREVNTFVSQFWFTGTFDVTTPLSINAALDFREWLGGEEAINSYCHQLALDGGRRLAEVMGTSVIEYAEEQTANMVTVRLPLSATIQPSINVTLMFQEALLTRHKVYATHFLHNGHWWTRASAQIFNEISDFERLGEAFVRVCADITAAHKQL